MTAAHNKSAGLKGLLAALLFFAAIGPLAASEAPPEQHWSLVVVAPADRATLDALAGNGFEVLGIDKAGARVLVTPMERERLAGLGFRFSVLHEDYGRYLTERSETGPQPSAATNFATGSMRGFFSPTEIANFVDSLRTIDTHGIISARFEIGRTLQDRPLWAVEVAGPDSAGAPEVLYDALIHAREGAGVMNLLYYLGWLVGNYGSVDSVTRLVDSRRMYFIPLVNPDGYEYNWDNYNNYGSIGLWRKNARDNNQNGQMDYNADGVDLNRNFSYKWDYDDVGSSPGWSAEAYRGTAAFSEPETQALRDFVNSRHFVSAVNLHSYAGVLINPWGYIDRLSPDSLLYKKAGVELTRENGYRPGNAYSLLGYYVNGEFTDWQYGDSSHSKIIAWSMEIGTESEGAFWPSTYWINYLCDRNLPFFYSLGHLSGFNPRLDSLVTVAQPPDSSRVAVGFRLTNSGFVTNRGPLRVALESADPGVTPDSAVVLKDLPLDSVLVLPPGALTAAFDGKQTRADLTVVVYEGDYRAAEFQITVSRTVKRFYDLDSSGRVDVFDLLLFLRRLGQGPQAGTDDSRYDMNGDGRVDVFDLLAILKNL